MLKLFLKFFLIFFSINLFAKEFPYGHTGTLHKFDLYTIIEQSTVRINIWQNYGEDNASTITGGTGIVFNHIDDNFYFLTNAHVLLKNHCFVEEYQNDECQFQKWEDDYSIFLDHPDSEFEYEVPNDNFTYWYEHDLAVIRLTISEEENDSKIFKPIPVGGTWYPLMDIFGAGFPAILGNYDSNYARMVFCSGDVKTMFLDEDELQQLSNYSIAHSCALAGGMSGGPLVDEYGYLLGINGLTGMSEYFEEQGKITYLDVKPANFNYAIDIWDLYNLEISDELGHFNPESIFYNYLPKLSFEYHEAFYEDFLELYPDKADKIKSLFF